MCKCTVSTCPLPTHWIFQVPLGFQNITISGDKAPLWFTLMLYKYQKITVFQREPLKVTRKYSESSLKHSGCNLDEKLLKLLRLGLESNMHLVAGLPGHNVYLILVSCVKLNFFLSLGNINLCSSSIAQIEITMYIHTHLHLLFVGSTHLQLNLV